MCLSGDGRWTKPLALQDRAKATRGAIIEGAASIFEVQGYGSASLAEVAERAKVTKGALYFHFKSKEDLAKAVIRTQHDMSLSRSAAILQGEHPALMTMKLLCRSFGQQLLDEPIVRAGIRLTFEASAFGYSVKDPYFDWISTMESLIRVAQNEGSLRTSVDAAALARYIVASFTGVQLLAEVLNGRKDLLDDIDKMWDFLLAGICN